MEAMGRLRGRGLPEGRIPRAGLGLPHKRQAVSLAPLSTVHQGAPPKSPPTFPLNVSVPEHLKLDTRDRTSGDSFFQNHAFSLQIPSTERKLQELSTYLCKPCIKSQRLVAAARHSTYLPSLAKQRREVADGKPAPQLVPSTMQAHHQLSRMRLRLLP